MIRPASTTDDATPNPNGIAAQNLIRLAAFTGDHAFREQADRLIEGVLALGGDNLFMHVALLNAIDMRLNLAEIVVTGEGAAADALVERRARAALRQPRGAARAVGRGVAGTRIRPRTRCKAAREPAAFICIGETCSLPVTNPDALTAVFAAPAST